MSPGPWGTSCSTTENTDPPLPTPVQTCSFQLQTTTPGQTRLLPCPPVWGSRETHCPGCGEQSSPAPDRRGPPSAILPLPRGDHSLPHTHREAAAVPPGSSGIPQAKASPSRCSLAPHGPAQRQGGGQHPRLGPELGRRLLPRLRLARRLRPQSSGLFPRSPLGPARWRCVTWTTLVNSS